MSSDKLFVQIASMPYSGTTLLSMLMGAHPEIATVSTMLGPEKPLDDYLCSCRKNIRECEFWQAVVRAMRSRGHEFDLADFGLRFETPASGPLHTMLNGSLQNTALEKLRDRLVRSLPEQRERLRRIGERNRAFVESVLEVTGKHVFVDASHVRMRTSQLRQHLGMDMRVVHLVRDARGWVNSSLWHKHQDGRRVMDMRRPARRWVKGNLDIARQLREFPPDHRITVRYEAVCQDVPGTMAELFQFCGVDPDVDVRDFRAAPQHITGNRMRLAESSEIRLDEGWRRTLKQSQLQVIDRVAGRLNRSLGNS